MTDRHAVELGIDADAALDAVGAATEIWGGDWQRTGRTARIELPVSAGVRHGWLDGHIAAESLASGSRVTLYTERIDYKLHLPSVVVLLMGALGAALMVVVPFFPDYIFLLPLSGLLLLAAWLLVGARLRHRNAVDFMRFVEEVHEEMANQRAS